MFNLFKNKNKIKELERRVTVLETQVTVLNKAKDEGFVLPLKDTEFTGKLANELANKMKENKNHELIVNINGAVLTKAVINEINKSQKRAGTILLKI